MSSIIRNVICTEVEPRFAFPRERDSFRKLPRRYGERFVRRVAIQWHRNDRVLYRHEKSRAYMK